MANGEQTVKYAYDQLNRLVKYTDALGKSETYKYNNYGDMTSKVDRNGITTNYTYDGLHRVTSEKAVKNGVTSAKYFTYALTGQLVLESNGSFSKGYSYAKDKSGKIYSDEQYTLNGLNYRTRRLYDVADRNNYIQTFRSDVSYPVYTLSYSFDSKGRLYMFSNQSASEYSSGGDYDIYYTYDKNDNIKTGKTRAGVTTEYNYNDANMLTSLVNKKDSTTYSTYSYNYNLDGNINRKVESGKATDYVYDGTGRLSNEKITNGSAVTNMTYAYDNAGNRSSLTVTGTENYVTTYSYDKNNRLLKDSKRNNGASYADVTLYSYDNNGNQIRKDQSKDDLTGKPKMGLYLATANSGYGYEKFTYNGFNQLTAFEDEAGNKATYEYYSDGLRLSKTVNGAKSSYIWADNDLAMEIKSDEVISYAKAPGYMRTGSSKDRTYRNDKLYLFNGHGDVTSMIDKSGNVTKTYSYDAFGNELNRDKNDTNPFRYCGEYWDNETESIYLRARYYNPSIGRFTTEDPIKDGSNWYAYCSGNPVVFIDSLGLFDYNTRLTVGSSGEDVKVLQHELQQRGFMSKDMIDEEGYFGEQTLQAVNNYKNYYGLGNTGANAGVVGQQTWQKLGLIYRSENDINLGVKIVTRGYKQYFDVSTAVNSALVNSRDEFASKDSILDAIWFYNQVSHNKPWDIKTSGSWKETIGTTYPGQNAEVILFGELVTVEMIGNITYGYLGTYMGYTPSELFGGGDFAAETYGKKGVKSILSGIKGAINASDSEEDKKRIRQGIDWANNSMECK